MKKFKDYITEAKQFPLEDIPGINELKDNYYNIADQYSATQDVVQELKGMSDDDAQLLGIDIKAELKIYTDIGKLMHKSKLGNKL
jgi:hypothetical protein